MRWLVFIGLLLPAVALAQEPNPAALSAAVVVNWANLQNAVGQMQSGYQQAAIDAAELRKRLAMALERCGEACRDLAQISPK